VQSGIRIKQRSAEVPLLTGCPRATMLGRNNNNRDHAVKLSIEDFRDALDIIGDAAGEEPAS
jgi:hypothetical protein